MGLLSKFQHPNIISIVGYSVHEEMGFIIYELMSNGSLEDLLHGKIFVPLFFSGLLCHGRWVKTLWNIEVLIYIYITFFFMDFVDAVGTSRGSSLNWHLRLKIALDTARWVAVFFLLIFKFLLFVCFSLSICLFQIVDSRGLEYLHEFCKPAVIHRDLKSSNILLDANFNAKVKMYKFF